MKKILLFSLFVFSVFTFGQKVKMKKGQVLFDDLPIYKYEEENQQITFSTLSGNEFLVLIENKYEVPNTNTYQYRDSPKTWTKRFLTIRFLSNGKELTTEASDKDLIKSIYKNQVVDENGKLDDEKVDIFINKYNNENLKSKLIQNTTVVVPSSQPRNGFNISIGR